jgi:hypothetical protein
MPMRAGEKDFRFLIAGFSIGGGAGALGEAIPLDGFTGFCRPSRAKNIEG